jgi:hypothetical protein
MMCAVLKYIIPKKNFSEKVNAVLGDLPDTPLSGGVLDNPPHKGKHGGARPNSGPKALEFTQAERNLVKALKATGKTHEQIASVIHDGIDTKTLEKHFALELKTAKTFLDGLATSKIVEAMQRGEAWALCFYAKTQMGWREKADVNLSGTVKLTTDVYEAFERDVARIAERNGTTEADPKL